MQNKVTQIEVAIMYFDPRVVWCPLTPRQCIHYTLNGCGFHLITMKTD